MKEEMRRPEVPNSLAHRTGLETTGRTENAHSKTRLDGRTRQGARGSRLRWKTLVVAGRSGETPLKGKKVARKNPPTTEKIEGICSVLVTGKEKGSKDNGNRPKDVPNGEKLKAPLHGPTTQERPGVTPKGGQSEHRSMPEPVPHYELQREERNHRRLAVSCPAWKI